MKLLRLALAVLAAVGLPVSASAQSREMQTVWVIQPTPVPAGERQLASGDFVLRQRLLPTGLVELTAPVLVRRETLSAGTQLVEVQAQGAKVFCIAEIARLEEESYQPCLIDADSDGDFESWFRGYSPTRSLLTVTGRYPREPNAIAETPYREVAPTTMRDTFFVGIERRNYFNIYSRENFMIAFGSAQRLERLTTPLSFRSSEMPKDMEVLGARFTALSETDGKMLIRVSRAMPVQAFGVAKTTTTRVH